MYFVYVLKSLKTGRRYIGFTSKSPQERLEAHNSGVSPWTHQNRPLTLVYQESFSDRQKARRREKFLKTGNGRKFLDNKIVL